MLRTYRKLMTLQRKVHLLIIAITYKFIDLHFTCNMEEDSGNTICKHCSTICPSERSMVTKHLILLGLSSSRIRMQLMFPRKTLTKSAWSYPWTLWGKRNGKWYNLYFTRKRQKFDFYKADIMTPFNKYCKTNEPKIPRN